jgi:hypothetical protein
MRPSDISELERAEFICSMVDRDMEGITFGFLILISKLGIQLWAESTGVTYFYERMKDKGVV